MLRRIAHASCTEKQIVLRFRTVAAKQHSVQLFFKPSLCFWLRKVELSVSSAFFYLEILNSALGVGIQNM